MRKLINNISCAIFGHVVIEKLRREPGGIPQDRSCCSRCGRDFGMIRFYEMCPVDHVMERRLCEIDEKGIHLVGGKKRARCVYCSYTEPYNPTESDEK